MDVLINRLGARGDGIAETADGPVYVPFALPGEKVSVRVGKSRGDGRAADLRDVLSPSADRQAAMCRHFGSGENGCGGCGGDCCCGGDVARASGPGAASGPVAGRCAARAAVAAWRSCSHAGGAARSAAALSRCKGVLPRFFGTEAGAAAASSSQPSPPPSGEGWRGEVDCAASPWGGGGCWSGGSGGGDGAGGGGAAPRAAPPACAPSA